MTRRQAEPDGLLRPIPPEAVLSEDGIARLRLTPAPELRDWALASFVLDGGILRNEEHTHLEFGDLCMLWAATGFNKQGRTVLGQAEQVMFRAGGWQKARQEQQMVDWFGRVPQFLITIDASFAATCMLLISGCSTNMPTTYVPVRPAWLQPLLPESRQRQWPRQCACRLA